MARVIGDLSWPDPDGVAEVDGSLDEAIDRNDPAELLRWIDSCCDTADWPRLARLRDRGLAAGDRGKQLGGVAAHAEYRMALAAPPEWAGPVCVEGTARFAPGPVPEVVAGRFSWAELAPHLPAGPTRAIVAHERVVRGEDLSALASSPGWGPDPLEMPLVLQPWEPQWALPTYRADGCDQPAPRLPRLERIGPPAPPGAGHRIVDDPEVGSALSRLVGAWQAHSGGRLDVTAAEGAAPEVLGSLGAPDPHWVVLTPAAALGRLAWAGSVGGAHGPRRGAAAGRAEMWWVLAALGGFLIDGDDSIDDPIDPGAVAEVVSHLTWWAWSPDGLDEPWSLRLVVSDVEENLTWVVDATDTS